jgi:two-component system response regulator MtrA
MACPSTRYGCRSCSTPDVTEGRGDRLLRSRGPAAAVCTVWKVNVRILLVEDDRSIREVVELGLQRAGFAVTPVGDGREALDRFRAGGHAAIVLDVMLPSLDGLEVCREIRRTSQVPIIMLTARAETPDIVAGLELGADDYITKPFEVPELVARLRSVLRRTAGAGAQGPLRVGDLEIDEEAFEVRRGGRRLALTATEFRLLAELARRPGRVFSRDLLLENVWGYGYLGDSRLVDVAVQRLRAKVEADPAHPALIVTVRGVGYRLQEPS